MELDEMKLAWSEMSRQLDKQNKLTNQLIMEMTQQKFKNKFSTLSIVEGFGAVICYVVVVFIGINMDKLDSGYLLVSSIILMAFLTIMPIFSLGAIRGMRNMNLTQNSYKDTLVKFTKRKRNMMLIQQLGVVLSIVIMWMAVPVFTVIMNGKNFLELEHSVGNWIFMIITTVGVILFALWGLRCYKRITTSAENVLKDLEERS
ncbi:MAG: hypothetical protein HKN48_04000 [Flavobacteriaceae bacterium]|nr:hypothetical protein [Flavobacteriaceae bacterium]